MVSPFMVDSFFDSITKSINFSKNLLGAPGRFPNEEDMVDRRPTLLVKRSQELYLECYKRFKTIWNTNK